MEGMLLREAGAAPKGRQGELKLQVSKLQVTGEETAWTWEAGQPHGSGSRGCIFSQQWFLTCAGSL